MSAGLASIEEKRAADRKRVVEYLESQRPFTDAEWAQIERDMNGEYIEPVDDEQWKD